MTDPDIAAVREALQEGRHTAMPTFAALARLEARLAETEARVETAEKARVEIETEWRSRLDEADEGYSYGAHVGIVRYDRAVARGLGEALNILSRALAGKDAA